MKFIIAASVVRTLSAFAPFVLAGTTAGLHAAPGGDTLSDAPTAVTALSKESLNGVRYSAGPIDAVLAARAANYYSTPQRPNGYAAERASQLFSTTGMVTPEDLEDKGVVPSQNYRLPFYTSLYAGYTDNLHVLPHTNEHSTAYLGAGIRTFQIINKEKFQGYLGLNLDNYILESAQFSRSGGDSYLKDFSLHTGGLLKLSDSVALSSRAEYDFTSFGTLGIGVAQPGVLFDDVLRYSSDTQLRYRFDGRKLNDPGLGLTTGLAFTGFDERGDDFGDFYRATLSQEFAWNPGGPLTYYFQARAGLTDYSNLRDFDADTYAGLFGVRGTCPNCGLNFDVAAGMERWSYDWDNLDDRTSFRAEASIEGRLTDSLDLRFTGSYGIQSLLPNAGTNFIDAKGFRGQLRLNWQPRTDLVLGIYGEYQNLSGDILQNLPETDLSHSGIGADLTWRLNDSVTISPGIMWLNKDGDGTDGDAFTGTLRTTFTF